jgi:hypothetical protein
MDAEIYPWRRVPSIQDAIAIARPFLIAQNIVEPTGGYAEEAIATAEKRLGAPIPADVREFQRAFRPTDVYGSRTDADFGFYALGSKEFVWQPMEEAEPSEDWKAAKGLALGQSTFGDPFWWIRGHRWIPDGSIVLLDHDGGMCLDIVFVYFARSFAEFLARVTHFGSLYSNAADALFQQECRELNPSAKR